MKLLLHICCAPCAIYPKRILEKSFKVTGFFYNPNIHPSHEYIRRKDTVKEFSEKYSFEVFYKDEYDVDKFLSAVNGDIENRCKTCYLMRLEETAREAAKMNFDYFSTSLLYSRYMKHELVREIGDELGRNFGIDFYYDDFRKGWQEGIRISKEMGLYRQKYCGCVFSELEREKKVMLNTKIQILK